MLTRFTYIIHSVTPSKTKNQRYFSLAGTYTASLCAKISVEMIYGFIFININITALGRNNLTGFFIVSLDAVADIFDEM